MSQPPELPDRIKRDLEEALRQGGVDKLPKRPRRRRREFRMGMLDPRPRGPGQLVLFGVVLLLLGLIVRVPYGTQVAILGLICVAVAVVTHLAQPHGYRRMFWRDRYIDVPSSRWQERIYRIIYRTK